MTFYTGTILLTELLMLAMTLHVLNYSGFTRQQRAWYLATFLAVMLCAGAELAVHGVPYRPPYAIPLTVLTVLQFSTAPLLAVLFAGALGLHRQNRFAVIFYALNLGLEVIAAPFGGVFYFNEAGYFRGPYFFLYEVMYFVSLIYLVWTMVIIGRNFRHRDTRTIVMMLIVLAAGILPMTLFRINITYIAIAISASLCYIYYNDLVQQDVKDALVTNQKKLSAMQTQMISGMANLIESRDLETGQHIARTGRYVKTLAEAARKEGVYTNLLTERFIFLLTTLAPLHDVGKILIPDRILQKPGRLTPEEFEVMKRHAAEGGRVVREILSGITDEESLTFASNIATYHHERWDGTGYPAGLKGEDIPLSARIMAIADVFDALISERCYKKPIPVEEAIRIIRAEAGSHFDPTLVRVFLEHKEAFLEW